MKKNTYFTVKGEKKPVYRYKVIDVFNIKKSNLFWKVVDHLSYKLEKIAKIYEKSISKEYIKELKMFNISDSQNILHIGCGAYPVTAITLSHYNGGKIVGIDLNSRSVKKARKLIEDKKLDDRIIIESGDGASYPVEDFDTIIVSSCSIPKINILKNLFNKAKSNSKIIVRELYGASSLVADCINSHEDIELVKKISNKPFPGSRWESYFLVKK